MAGMPDLSQRQKKMADFDPFQYRPALHCFDATLSLFGDI
jgi:hypothetical protein